jgi:uncharacterized phage protein (TIGR01671 family)
MRDIKLRAWENENARNKMFEWDIVKKDITSWLNCNDTIIMQYTGLKDKNGKEIYEGDIIIGSSQEELNKPLRSGRYKVIWEDAGFVASKIDGEGCDTWLFFFRTNINSRPLTECEIIGNIYETPSLIN